MKTKEQLELNLAKDMKSNRKGFLRYTGQQRKKKKLHPPMTQTGDWATASMERMDPAHPIKK